MILEELVLHNFGVYRGRQSFDLTVSPDRPIVLIGAMNGNGKTTFLDALQLAFYGKQAQCSGRKGLSYDEYLRRSVNRAIGPSEGVAIEVQFRQRSGGEEARLRIHRSWSIESGSVRERFEVIKNGREDRVLTEQWQEFLEEVLPPRMAPLFFFDGEKIEQFADPSTSSSILSSAVHALLGLDLVERLGTDLEVLERRKRTAGVNDEQREGIEARNQEIAEIENQLRDYREQRASANARCERAENIAEKARTEFATQGGNIFERREELRERRAEVATLAAETEKHMRGIAADALPLLIVQDLLEEARVQDALEAEAENALSVLDVLGGRDQEILNQLKQASASEAMLQQVERFLEDDRSRRKETSQVERYLSLTGDGRRQLEHLLEQGLQSAQGSSQNHIDQFEEHSRELDVLDRQMASMPAPEEIQELARRVESAEKDVAELNTAIEELDQKIGAAERTINHQRSILTGLLDKQVQSALEEEDRTRLLHHAEKVRETLGTFREKVVAHHLSRLEAEILDCLSQLLRKDPLVSRVKIEPSTFGLELKGGDWRNIHPERLSAGERQLFAVALLWALGRISGCPAPAVIDTPLGRLDSVHRKNLVERYFPFASHQVILLSTDEEIDAAALTALQPHLSRTYRIDYDPEAQSSRVSDGYLVEEAA